VVSASPDREHDGTYPTGTYPTGRSAADCLRGLAFSGRKGRSALKGGLDAVLTACDHLDDSAAAQTAKDG
jgi:hypothetical protein